MAGELREQKYGPLLMPVVGPLVREVIESRDEAMDEIGHYMEAVSRLRRDRDTWKARAEELERALQDIASMPSTSSGPGMRARAALSKQEPAQDKHCKDCGERGDNQ